MLASTWSPQQRRVRASRPRTLGAASTSGHGLLSDAGTCCVDSQALLSQPRTLTLTMHKHCCTCCCKTRRALGAHQGQLGLLTALHAGGSFCQQALHKLLQECGHCLRTPGSGTAPVIWCPMFAEEHSRMLPHTLLHSLFCTLFCSLACPYAGCMLQLPCPCCQRLSVQVLRRVDIRPNAAARLPSPAEVRLPGGSRTYWGTPRVARGRAPAAR